MHSNINERLAFSTRFLISTNTARTLIKENYNYLVIIINIENQN